MADVLIIQRIFSAYRKSVFDELNKQIDFTLLHSKKKSGIRQVTAPYAKIIGSISYSRNKTNVFLNVFKEIYKTRPKLIIHEFSIAIISLVPTFLMAKLFKIKFILWGHGYNRKKGFNPEKSLLDKLRLFFTKRADAIIFYGKEARLKYSKYVKSEKLFIAHNCLNTNYLTAIRNKLEKEGIDNVKKRIGFMFKYNLIFIGRILKYKQPQLIIDVYEHLNKIYKDSIYVHFVGDGNYLKQLKEIVKYKGVENNFRFYGAIYNDVKNGELLYCSDLMIMPGPVGLSVNHAFNFDCPVVTFKQRGHGPEIEYLINEKTGYIVEENIPKAMAIVISKYLNNKDVQNQFRKNLRIMIENICSINNFIKGFKDASDYVLFK